MHRYVRSRSSESWLTSYADLITNLLIFFVLIISASQIQPAKMERIAESMSKTKSPKSLSTAKTEVEAKLKEMNLEKEVSVNLDDNGLAVSFNSGVMFNSGSADILNSMETSLAGVLTVISPYEAHYNFAVEGHTDETPVRTGLFESNWELSSARAMAIRKRLEKSGVPQTKIRVEAYADTRPLPVPKDFDRALALAKQRRVVLRLF